MRTAAFLFLLSALAVVADLSYVCAGQAREAVRKQTNLVPVIVEDWEYGSYFAAGLGLCAAAWLAGTLVPPERRVARLVIPTVRLSVIVAAVCGLFMTVGLGAWFLATGQDPDDRVGWESRWVGGSVLGAVAGAAIGAGLGTVAYFRRPKRGSDSATSSA
jgi:hypothetical protein